MHSNQDRLLNISKLFFEETGINKEIGIEEITDHLRSIFPDMRLDPRTIRTDILTLTNNGFVITERKGKFGRIYYSHQERIFKSQELRYIIDAISSAPFIPETNKEEMIEKMKNLSGKPDAEIVADMEVPIKDEKE